MAIKRQFLVSFMVDARGGAMRGCRHSGVRVIIPPRKAAMPMRITCRYLKKDKLVHAPPLMEGEALASRILEMGPSGAKFLGPVIIEVPHFASLRGKEREIVILRSDNGETWREHTLEATEEAVQEVLNESFDGEELKQLEDLNTNRITRILTTDFPQYFAIVTRIRQEVHAIGPEGGMVSSTVVPQVQAVFPQGALTKKIKVGLQAQPINTELVAKLLGNRVAVSPIVTVEPRRRKFHKPITLTIPVPQAASKGMINQYSGEAPTLRLLCSITGGTTRAQWEDVTGSTPLTFVNDCVSFTTTVSARFWLMDCTNIPEATKMATELYREAIHVPFMAKFVVFSKRHAAEEARVRVFCMTDDKEDKTLETQEHFVEVAKSRDVEVLEGKTQYLEFAGNLIPVTKSGDQLAFNFYAFRENRLPFTVRVKDPNAESVGRVAFMRQPKVGRGEAPQSPICNLNLSLPDNIQPEPAPSEPDLLALEKKYAFLSISKADTIHKADLRLSDISNMLAGDWVALAKELDVSDSDINIIKSQYPDNIPQQAIVMLRLWMQIAGNKATGNTLEKALRSIHRDDIVNECICNLEEVTDDREKAVAKEHLDQSDVPSSFDTKDSVAAHELDESHKILQVPNGQDEGISEMEIVPELRSTTLHTTSQVIVDSIRAESPQDIPKPVCVEKVSESDQVEEIPHPQSQVGELLAAQPEMRATESAKDVDVYKVISSHENVTSEFPTHSIIERREESLETDLEAPNELSGTQSLVEPISSYSEIAGKENLVRIPNALGPQVSSEKEEIISSISKPYDIKQDIVETLVERTSEIPVVPEEIILEETLQTELSVIPKESLQPEAEVTHGIGISPDVNISFEEKFLQMSTEAPVPFERSSEPEHLLAREELPQTIHTNIISPFINESSPEVEYLLTRKEHPEAIQEDISHSGMKFIPDHYPNSEYLLRYEEHPESIRDEISHSEVKFIPSEIPETKTEIFNELLISKPEDKDVESIISIAQDQSNLVFTRPSTEEEIVRSTSAIEPIVEFEDKVFVQSSLDDLRHQIEPFFEQNEHMIVTERLVEPKPTDSMVYDVVESKPLLAPENKESEPAETREQPITEEKVMKTQDLEVTVEEKGVKKQDLEVTFEDKVMRKQDDKVTTEDIKLVSEPSAQMDTPTLKDELTQPSVHESQMVHGVCTPTDVKPQVPANELATTETQPFKLEIDDGESAPIDSSKLKDVGVVFTEPKESGGGEKLPTETNGGNITTQITTLSSHISPTQHLGDDSRPQRRHERSFSQASNIVSSTTIVNPETSFGHIGESDVAIESNVRPYSERKQFWETVTSQSFETKSPVAKSETESDTDTGTDGTVIEKSFEKVSSLTECSDSDLDSSQRREPSFYENVKLRSKKGPDKMPPVGSQDLPSPEDISLKDVKTKKEMFEKEIKRQSSELEESVGWKRSSNEFEEQPEPEVHKTSTFVKEEIAVSSDITAVNEKQSRQKVSEQQGETSLLKMVEKTDKETRQLSEITKEEKLKYEKTVTDDKKNITEKEISSKEDVDKEVKDDRAKMYFRSVEEKDDGSVVKTKVKEASKMHVSHEQLEGKSETIVIDYDKEKGESSRHEQSSTSSVDFTESTSSNLIKSEVKFALGTTSQLSSTDTTDSTNGSFERSDSTKESFEKSCSSSRTLSSSQKQGTLTSSADDHDLPEFPEDTPASEIKTDSSGRLVEKKIEEEKRKFGDTEELLVREITTTREGGHEQKVVKETKTQETLMADGSTVKTTSVTTFTTHLDRGDSEESASSTTEREKSEVLLKQQIKADIFAEGIDEKSDDLSPEHKVLTPKESRKVIFDAPVTSLASPIHVPEESFQDVVWEVSQEQSEAPLSETVQYIGADQLPSEESACESKVDESVEIVLTEEEARGIAEEIVEEVKQEALKRSSMPTKDVIINRVEIENRIILPKPSSSAAFTTETSDKIEKYIQERLTEAKLDPQHLNLIESVTAKKTEMLRKRLGSHDLQISLEITDEDLKCSGVEADYSPIERQMEKLRQMTEDDDQTKSAREPSEADESESSMIIHDAPEEPFSSGYDQANQMFNKTLDTVKSVNLKGERIISTISEEIDDIAPKTEIGSLEKRKISREELKEAAIEIVKEVTDKAKDSEVVKHVIELAKDEKDFVTDESKSLREEMKQDRSIDMPMESSMTESVEECSAAESTRAYESKFITEMSKTSIQEVAENGSDKKPSEKIPPSVTEEIRFRKKTHIDEFNRRSGADFDAGSSSGESHYFTAGEGTDSRSVSRPCSSDVEILLSATTGTSDYDTALTSQDGSQYSSSRDFSTAPCSISSRDSMKSIDSESSGNLGSIELSEASETLVPSTLDLERDMEILDKELLEEELMHSEQRSHSAIPQLTIHSGTPKSEDIPSSFDDRDDAKDVPYVSSKMKRSVEMTFHPEPKVIKGDDIEFVAPTSEDTSLGSDQTGIESSLSESGSSRISNQTAPLSVETKDAATEQLQKPDDGTSKDLKGATTSVTITATSVPSSHPDDTTSSMCTQVTSEVRSETVESDSYFRANGPTEVECVALGNDVANVEGLVAAPVFSDEEPLGAVGSRSVGPDSSDFENFAPEADQEYSQMMREGEDFGATESEVLGIDSEPEDEMDNMRPDGREVIERPTTPEPGSFSKLTIKESQEPEELTEVDKRFSAIFSITYEEPESPAPDSRKLPIEIVPDITITEHMAPIDGRYRYPDLECDDEFPECRKNGIESTSHSTPSSVTSPKSSTTDSEHGREYCLDSQTEGPVQYSEHGSFELLEATEIQDLDEYQNTLLRHEQRVRDLTTREEDEVSSQESKKDESPILQLTTIRAIKLDSESPTSSGEGDLSRGTEETAYSSSIEEQRRWLEMQFEENAEKSSDFDFQPQTYDHIYSGPLEDIEEEREEYERRDLSHLAKTPSLSSTPEYDVLAGKKFFTRSGEHDDISMSSLQEFEKFESDMAIETATRRSSSGSQESLNGKRPGSGNKSLGDDVSVSSFSSLNEFETLEKECMVAEQTDTKVKIDDQILSEIEEGHESQVSESESCETVSEIGRESPDNYEQKIFEIDEIIRQAQSNVEKFEKDVVPLKDIVGISSSTGERTPSAEPQDSLEESLPQVGREIVLTQHHLVSPTTKKEERSPDGMATSIDSLDSKHGKDLMVSSSDSLEDSKKRQDLIMSASLDSIESAKRDLMATSIDSLGRDDSSGREGDISSESERVTHAFGGVMEESTDSLEPTSSQATHATYQYETDSVMSGSFTSGCSTTLMPAGDEISDLMSASMYIPEGEIHEDTLSGMGGLAYQWMKVKPEHIVKETVLETPESEFTRTVTKTITLQPEVKQVTFTGPDAEEKLKTFIDKFDSGEHTCETETIDEAGNVHVKKIVQKRIVMDPTFAEEQGVIKSEPEIEESFQRDQHGNVTRVVRRTVISTHTVEIDLDTGEPIIHRQSSPVTASTHSTSSLAVTPSSSPQLSSHPTGSPSGSHSPREPLPTSLEPNTASGGELSQDIVQSYGELSDQDDADPSLITITDPTSPYYGTPSTVSSSTSYVTTSVDPSGGAKTTIVTTRIVDGRRYSENEEDEKSE